MNQLTIPKSLRPSEKAVAPLGRMENVSKTTARIKKIKARANNRNSVSRICFLEIPEVPKNENPVNTIDKNGGKMGILGIKNTVHLKETVNQKQ